MARKSQKKGFLFTKMHGIGNDCIIFYEATKPYLPRNKAAMRGLCSRSTGIGADQAIVISTSKKADFKMQTYNADGSEAEMCGNGIRCAAIYIKEKNISKKKELTFETLAGIIPVTILGIRKCRVDIGEPRMKGKEIPVNLSGRIINRPIKVDNKDFRITCLSVGNPHCVIFKEKLDTLDIERYGPQLETLNIFPKKSNVEFVDILGKNEIAMRVWERGVGETQACGTGACAAAVASVLNGHTGRKVRVNLKGGQLEIEWDRNTNRISMTGPAEFIYEGEIAL
ncbi:diaminopimelate epimerase [bacterium]|nr:diaminopimelate epimerase [bacterium]